jgi:hypothetical protein
MKILKKIIILIILLTVIFIGAYFLLGVKMVKSIQNTSDEGEMLHCFSEFFQEDKDYSYIRKDFYFKGDQERHHTILSNNKEGDSKEDLIINFLQDKNGDIYSWQIGGDLPHSYYKKSEYGPESVWWPSYFLGKKQNSFQIITEIKDHNYFFQSMINYYFYYNCSTKKIDKSLFELPEGIYFKEGEIIDLSE